MAMPHKDLNDPTRSIPYSVSIPRWMRKYIRETPEIKPSKLFQEHAGHLKTKNNGPLFFSSPIAGCTQLRLAAHAWCALGAVVR